MAASKKKKRAQRTPPPTEALPQAKWAQVSKLRPSRNARLHAPEQVALIAASIEDIGWTNPPIVDEKGFILAGHGRWQAAKLLKLKRIPVIPKEGLSDAQKRTYILADNRIAELAGWDPMILATELTALGGLGVNLERIGFDADAVRDALAKAGRRMNAAAAPDDTPEKPKKVTTLLGDVWLLGEHRISCGDATKPEDVDRLLAGAKPDLCVTDPPYGVDYDPEWRVVLPADRGWSKGTKPIENDDRVDWSAAWRLFPGSVLYAWCAGGGLIIEAAQALLAAGFELRSGLIWRKSHFPLSRGHYTYQHESCWYAVRKGGKALWVGSKSASSVWEVDRQKAEMDVSGRHVARKPVELFRIALDNHRGDVYDPFLGSGTCLIAAEVTGKTCYGLELLPDFVDVSVLRWQGFASSEAVLEASGQTFAEVAAERKKAAA